MESTESAETALRPDAPGAPDPNQPGVGQVLGGRYLLQDRLGAGGMGVVFKALDQFVAGGKVQGPPFVAVKVVNTREEVGAVAIQAIRQEGERLRSLRDDNIVAMREVARDGEIWFLVMELLVGEPLDAVIARYPEGVPLADGQNLITQICLGVKYLHKKKVIHSDLKPGNVFVTQSQEVKILDFGISDKIRAIGESAPQSDPKHWGALSPLYASLELWDGARPDPRDDIYSLGCIAYELLNGKHPFAPATAKDRAAPGAKIKLIPITAINRRQNQAIRNALALRRADRTPSVDKFLGEFTRPPPPIKRLIASMATALVICTLAIAFFWQRQKGEPNVIIPAATAGAAKQQPQSSAEPVPTLLTQSGDCSGPPSASTLDAEVSAGLEVRTRFMTDVSSAGAEQPIAELRKIASCIRSLNKAGFKSTESQATLSDIDRILKSAAKP